MSLAVYPGSFDPLTLGHVDIVARATTLFDVVVIGIAHNAAKAGHYLLDAEERLALARALYKDGPILVLDEPTAALDSLAEYDMYQRLAQMTEGKTSIFISHRLSSTRFCDRILLLEEGRVVEEGSHEELLRRGGKYAELFNVQAQYYKEDARNAG